MECLREMPAFPRGHAAAPWLPEAERLYAGARPRRDPSGCLRCPHRDAPLEGLPVRRGRGGVPEHRECIHGLRWAADPPEAGPHLLSGL